MILFLLYHASRLSLLCPVKVTGVKTYQYTNAKEVISQAAPGAAPSAGGAPTVVAYQGEVLVSGSPYTGDGHFKFAVVNAASDTMSWPKIHVRLKII